MNKVLGILGLLVFVCLLTSTLNPNFVTTYNIQNTLRWTSLFGILGIGVAFVIITGGIDLSIGSLVGLIGCLLPIALEAMSLREPGEALNLTLLGCGIAIWLAGAIWLHARAFQDSLREGLLVLLVPFYVLYYLAFHFATLRRPLALYVTGVLLILAGWLLPPQPVPAVTSILLPLIWMIAISAAIGLLHGVLITQVRLQPFVVTLCGLLIYRGLARWVTNDQTRGFGTGYQGLKVLATGQPLTMAELLLCLAGMVLVWSLYRRVRDGRLRSLQPLQAPRIPGWCPALIALVVACCCGLQLFQDIAALPRGVTSWTQTALYWSGLTGLIGGFIAMDALAIQRRHWSMLGANLVLLISLGLLATLLALTGSDARGDRAAWWMMLALTPVLLGIMLSVVVFLRLHWREQPDRRWLSLLTAASGMLLLAGMTPLDRVRVPAPFLILLALAVVAGVLLNKTIYGRYLLALGRNEEAARYSGINTHSMIIAAYILCSVFAGIAAILFALDINSVQPASHGNFFELYAIAAAVLGGCSLRGGEGSILGVIIGTAVMRVLYNAITILGIPTQMEFAIIGAVILAGVIVDAAIHNERKLS